jgi:hypothetical protein
MLRDLSEHLPYHVLTSRPQSFEADFLAQKENLDGLAAINRELIARAKSIKSPQPVVLDMDNTDIPVYGQQENSAYNRHFESTCYHPRLLFNRAGTVWGPSYERGAVPLLCRTERFSP